MKWNTHVEHFIQKTKGVFGLLRSTLAGPPLQVKLWAYKTLCRPIIEYYFEVWVSYTATHSSMLEDI